MTLLVRRAGFLSTVQDLGRVGHRASGVSLGGALDTQALRVANLLVDNDQGAAGLELTLGNVRLQFNEERLVAWCGGPFEVGVQGRALTAGRAALLAAGEELIATAPSSGARAWLAISSGIDVPFVLGSRSTDLRSGFGGHEGRPLRDGDVLNLGLASAKIAQIIKPLSSSRIASWSAPNEWSNTRSPHGFLRFVRGADWSQFSAEALTGAAFTVTPDSDRTGVRLEGAQLTRGSNEDLISEPVTPGTLQVPPNGQPILLLGDCQTIGGYPKIAHVITVDLPAAAQLRPSDTVRFAEISLTEAQQLLLEREHDVERFRVGVSLRTAWS